MKLPDKNDSHGNNEGSLPRQIVFEVLKENGVKITDHHGFYLLEQSIKLDGEPSFITHVCQMIDPTGGVAVRAISRIFLIDLVSFYYDPLTKKRRHKPH